MRYSLDSYLGLVNSRLIGNGGQMRTFGVGYLIHKIGNGKEKKLTKKIIQTIIGENRIQLLKKKYITPLWLPSAWSFSLITLGFILLGILAHLEINSNLIPDPLQSFLSRHSSPDQNLIAIAIGIGAVLIGLAFFVAQSLLDKEDPDKALVLLYESQFFPLLISEIFIFLLLLTGDMNFLIYIIIIIFGFVITLSLERTIRIMIRSSDMEQSKTKLFKDILKKSFIQIIENDIKRRDDISCFYNRGREISSKYSGIVEFSAFRPTVNDIYLKINAPVEGTIADVNYVKLEKFIREVYNTYSSALKVNHNGLDTKDNMIGTSIPDRSPLLYIIAYPSSQVDAKSTLVEIRADVSFLKRKPEYIIQKQVQSIFIIKPDTNDAETTRYELMRLKHQCFTYIKNEDRDRLSAALDIYSVLVKEFYQIMAGFSKEQAKKEEESIFGLNIRPIDWIAADIAEIFEKLTTTSSPAIINLLVSLPRSLTILSIQNKDFLLFQNYIRYVISLYILGFKMRDDNPRASLHLIDSSWRMLQETANYYLVNEYEEKRMTRDEFLDFAAYMYKMYQYLLKNCFDKSDLNNYKLYISKVEKLFGDTYQTRNLYIRKDKKESEQVLLLKNEVCFGMASWILSISLQSGKADTSFYFETIRNLKIDIVEFTKLYLGLRSFKRIDDWGWDDWEFSLHEEGEVFSISFIDKLDLFYVVKSLDIIKNKTHEEIMQIKLPLTQELAFLAKDSGNLKKLIQKCKDNPKELEQVIGTDSLKKCDVFLSLLEKSSQAYDEEVKRIIRRTRISQDKVAIFQDSVWKNFSMAGGIRRILEEYELISYTESGKSDNSKKVGIHAFLDKTAFIPDEVLPHIVFLGIDDGFDFGRSIIQGEDKELLNTIRKSTKLIKPEEFDIYLNQLISLNDTIILCVNGGASEFFESKFSHDIYIPNWNKDFENVAKKFKSKILEGVFFNENQAIPVYEIFMSDSSRCSEIFVLEINKIGQLTQHLPVSSRLNNDKSDYLWVDVLEILKESPLEEEILTSPPAWLMEIGDTNEQAQYLEEQVVIKIFETFDFEINQSIVGVRFQV
jgi:hypothetical protein